MTNDKQLRMKSCKQCINMTVPELRIVRVSFYFDDVSFHRQNNPVSEALQPKVKIWQKRPKGLSIIRKGKKNRNKKLVTT